MSQHDADTLLRQAKQAGIENDPAVKPWLDALIQFPHEDWICEAAASVIGRHGQRYLQDPFAFRPEYLRPTEQPQQDWHQGHCQGQDIYIPRGWRKRSELVVGKPGTGKSTYVQQQIAQAQDKDVAVWLFDFKDEHGPFCQDHNIPTLHYHQLRINPHEWLDTADQVECFSHANLFQNASTGYYRDVLHRLKQVYDNELPSLHHDRQMAQLLSPEKSRPPEYKIDPSRRQTLTARDRVLRALDDLLAPYGEIFDCQTGFPIAELADRSIRFVMHGMAYKEATYLIYILLKALYRYRSQSRRQQQEFDQPLTNLIVVEEAKHVVSQLMEREMRTAPAFIRTITTEVRSAGIGYLFSDQVPSALAISAIESCNLMTLFRIGLEEDLSAIGGAMGLTNEQRQLIYELPDRTAVTKHGEKKPIRIGIPSEGER